MEKFFDYHLPVDGFRIPNKKDTYRGLFIPTVYKDDFDHEKHLTPVTSDELVTKALLKKLQALNYYDKEGKRTKKDVKEVIESDKINAPKTFKPLGEKFVIHPHQELLWQYQNPSDIKDEDYIDYMPSDIENLQFEELLPKTLLDKTLLWKSDIKSPAPQFRLVGEGGPFDDIDDAQDSRDFKISKIKYPVLHPRVKKYLSLMKKYITAFLKTGEFPYSAIEIIPRSNSMISVFIISDAAKKYYKEQFDNDDVFNSLEIAFNLLNQLSEQFAGDHDIILKPDVTYMVIKKDKSLRFQSIMSKRLNRIKKDIFSLNQLHNKKNYVFEKNDFNEALLDINQALGHFESKFEDYFSTNKKTKVNQEISEVFAKLDKDQKQQLITLIKEEKK